MERSCRVLKFPHVERCRGVSKVSSLRSAASRDLDTLSAAAARKEAAGVRATRRFEGFIVLPYRLTVHIGTRGRLEEAASLSLSLSFRKTSPGQRTPSLCSLCAGGWSLYDASIRFRRKRKRECDASSRGSRTHQSGFDRALWKYPTLSLAKTRTWPAVSRIRSEPLAVGRGEILFPGRNFLGSLFSASGCFAVEILR